MSIDENEDEDVLDKIVNNDTNDIDVLTEVNNLMNYVTPNQNNNFVNLQFAEKVQTIKSVTAGQTENSDEDILDEIGHNVTVGNELDNDNDVLMEVDNMMNVTVGNFEEGILKNDEFEDSDNDILNQVNEIKSGTVGNNNPMTPMDNDDDLVTMNEEIETIYSDKDDNDSSDGMYKEVN